MDLSGEWRRFYETHGGGPPRFHDKWFRFVTAADCPRPALPQCFDARRDTGFTAPGHATECARRGVNCTPWRGAVARIRALSTQGTGHMASPDVALDIERARFNMIEQQIRPWDVLDQTVLDLLATVRREEFVPPQYRLLAFTDMEVPLRLDDGDTGERMFAPKVEARFMQELQLRA